MSLGEPLLSFALIALTCQSLLRMVGAQGQGPVPHSFYHAHGFLLEIACRWSELVPGGSRASWVLLRWLWDQLTLS